MSALEPNPPRLDPIPPDTEACGCCIGNGRETPVAIENRAGLGAVAYRIGAYAQFRASMHAGLSSAEFDVLSHLRTRDDDDFTIGLLDAFSCAADVLTFYQERIANESYLRTARERLSLQEMGRLIGYRLRPGIAAETVLAFTLETPPSPPSGVKPEPGLFVTGVPGELTIDAGLAVRSVPAPGEQPQVFETVEAVTARPAWNAMQPWMSEAPRLNRGATFTYLSGVNTNLRRGDALLFVGPDYLPDRRADQWEFRILERVDADVANDRTFVSWARPFESFEPNQEPPPLVYALRQRASAYGHNAPTWLAMPAQFRADYEVGFPRFETVPPVILRTADAVREDWPHLVISPAANSVDLDSVRSEIVAGSFAVLARGRFGIVGTLAASSGGGVAELYTVTGVTEVAREEFALAGKVTRLALDGPHYDAFANDVRGITVFGQSEPLPLADYPVDDPVAGANIPVSVGADGLFSGRRLLVRGTRESDGAPIVQAAVLVAAHPVAARKDARSTLEIDPPLSAPLVRASLAVHANVALSTHGESVAQILGNGSAAAPFQRFELKQLPLTFRAAPAELGSASELTVRVDDIAWKERDSLFGATPRDRVFTLVSDERGRTFVQFGDGVRGARPTTGTNNVRASYRKGIGEAGNVAAESLTQLTTRPLGLKGVSNPLGAEGGTDPENADLARQNMPLLTRTLGRAVSVLDYEDFARAYSGVAKARAEVLQLHGGTTVVITIAGPNGTPISADSPILINLRAALAANGDPHVAVRLLTHGSGKFRLGLKVKPDPDRDRKQVLRDVEAELRSAFGPDARGLEQPVQQSEVIAVVQRVPGVLAMDLDLFYGGTEPPSQTVPSRQTRLLAGRMSVQDGEPIASELLTLDSGPFDHLQEMP